MKSTAFALIAIPRWILWCWFALALAACTQEKTAFHSIDLTGAQYAQQWRLPDANGQIRTLADFQGKVVVVFFGYAQCPDVCPTTLAEVSQAKALLGKDGERVTAVFITLDPERDTPQVLKAYMQNFDPSFVALRGSEQEIARHAQEFKIYYKKVEGKTASSYTFDHSAASFVYDTHGKLRLYTRYGQGAPALAHDIRLLLQTSQ